MQWVLTTLLGFIAGILTGFFGIGGGIVFVPLIFSLLQSNGLSSRDASIIATGTSLGAMIFPSFSSGVRYLKLKYMHTSTVLITLSGFIPSSALGTLIVNKIGGEPLRFLFSLFTLWGAFRMFKKGMSSQGSVDYGDTGVSEFVGNKKVTPKESLFLFLLGVFSGVSSGMLGIGGGVFVVLCLTTFLKYPPGAAVGTSTAVAFFASLSGSIFRAALSEAVPDAPPHTVGSLYIPMAISLGIPAILGSQLGVLIHRKVRSRWFYITFGTILIVVTIKLVIS